MTELYERIAAGRARKGLTLQQVGDHFEITAQAVKQWESPPTAKSSKPSLERLVRLADLFEMSLDELLRSEAIPLLPLRPSAADIEGRWFAPMLSRVQAGQWGDVITPDNLPPEITFMEISQKPVGYALVLEIDGESMLDEFRPRDLIVIDTGLEPTPGDFVVAVLEREQEATFKRYRLRGYDDQNQPIIDLIPLNPDWPTLTLDGERRGRILGTMIEHRRLRRSRSRAA